MRNRLYITPGIDSAPGIAIAQNILEALGAEIIDGSSLSRIPVGYADHDPVLLYMSTGLRIPGKYLRVLPSARGAIERGMYVPASLLPLVEHQDLPLVAIQPSACEDRLLIRLRVALTNMHQRDNRTGRWTGPKERRKRPIRRGRARFHDYALG